MSKETKDLLRTILELRHRVDRLEQSCGRAGILDAYQPPSIPTVDPEPEPQPMTTKKKADAPPPLDETRLWEMSHSEVVQVAQMVGFEHASRAISKDELIGLILGDLQGVVDDPLDVVRSRTFAFVRGNRRLMVSKMRCSLHCPTCPHHRVVECYSANHDIVDAQPHS